MTRINTSLRASERELGNVNFSASNFGATTRNLFLVVTVFVVVVVDVEVVVVVVVVVVVAATVVEVV